MSAAGKYLRLNGAYCEYLGGIRWSTEENVLEYHLKSSHKVTFALVEEIAIFLEGFANRRPLIHFAFILHLVDLIRNKRGIRHLEFHRLQQAFAETGKKLRNAGGFAAVLCQDIPEVGGRVYCDEVIDRLLNAMPIRWFVGSFHDTFFPSENPPYGPSEFERILTEALQPYTDDDLREWLRHGTGPVRVAGREISRHLTLPPSLGRVLASLLERPRLAGARPLVSQLMSALTLPQRKLEPQKISTGGYSDVITKGQFEQVLPSQFALDELEFYRRFAEQELLYFRREEPNTKTRRELVVLLDQGVRTWGGVRLILAAAALALGKQAEKDRIPFFLATTGNYGTLLDPTQEETDSFGELVEASDLTPNPAKALKEVLDQPAEIDRDIILLTHSRNLHEKDVSHAALRLILPARLFAVGLDDQGSVQLVEMRQGNPVVVKIFHVDPHLLEESVKEEEPIDFPSKKSWKGYVEPVGYPFQFGSAGPLHSKLFDFDLESNWLFTSYKTGIIFAWKTDGNYFEILPRGCHHNMILKEPRALIGVSDGLVVIGFLGRGLFLFHYKMRQRICNRLFLGDRWDKNSCCYLPEYNTVIVDPGPACIGVMAIDLGDYSTYRPDNKVNSSRLEEAMRFYYSQGAPTGRMTIRYTQSTKYFESHKNTGVFELDFKNGEVFVYDEAGYSWDPFIPRQDGQPLLRSCNPIQTQKRGNLLAVKVQNNSLSIKPSSNYSLHILKGPYGKLISSFPSTTFQQFLLSRDGNFIALEQPNKELALYSLKQGAAWNVPLKKGHFHHKVSVSVGESRLLVSTGKAQYQIIDWSGEKLTVQYHRNEIAHQASVRAQQYREGFFQSYPHLKKYSEEQIKQYHPVLIPKLMNHSERFVNYVPVNNGFFLVDRFGQIAVVNRNEEVVGMMFSFRDQFAAWMPDGTCFGSPNLLGCPPTPNAGKKIAQLLKAIVNRGENQQ